MANLWEIIMKSDVKTAKRFPLAFSTVMVLACASVVSSAFADDQVRTETVKFQDLNVDTPAGVQALYTRIHSAAKRVCSENDPVLRLASALCIRKAEAKAVETVSIPQLTAYYRMKTGEHTQALAASR
jgi:UrcA family protein